MLLWKYCHSHSFSRANVRTRFKHAHSFCRCVAEGHFVCACAFGINNLYCAFGVILINLALFCGFSIGRSTPFCNIFWRGVKEYDKFATISNPVDTRGVCWLFGWGCFNYQSAKKTREKVENLNIEIWITEDQDVHMRQQTLKVSLCESRSCMWRQSWDIRYDNRW